MKLQQDKLKQRQGTSVKIPDLTAHRSNRNSKVIAQVGGSSFKGKDSAAHGYNYVTYEYSSNGRYTYGSKIEDKNGWYHANAGKTLSCT